MTTPAVTKNGRIIWLDADGNRDFSPRTQRALMWVTGIFLAIFLGLALGLLTGIIEPAPGSPLDRRDRQEQEQQYPDTSKPVERPGTNV